MHALYQITVNASFHGATVLPSTAYAAEIVCPFVAYSWTASKQLTTWFNCCHDVVSPSL